MRPSPKSRIAAGAVRASDGSVTDAVFGGVHNAATWCPGTVQALPARIESTACAAKNPGASSANRGNRRPASQLITGSSANASASVRAAAPRSAGVIGCATLVDVASNIPTSQRSPCTSYTG